MAEPYRFQRDGPPPGGIRFEKTVTAGNILTVLAGIVAMTGAYVDYRLTMDRHEVRIGNVEGREAKQEQQSLDLAKAQQEMVRAIDRLTYELQTKPPQ